MARYYIAKAKTINARFLFQCQWDIGKIASYKLDLVPTRARLQHGLCMYSYS